MIDNYATNWFCTQVHEETSPSNFANCKSINNIFFIPLTMKSTICWTFYHSMIFFKFCSLQVSSATSKFEHIIYQFFMLLQRWRSFHMETEGEEMNAKSFQSVLQVKCYCSTFRYFSLIYAVRKLCAKNTSSSDLWRRKKRWTWEMKRVMQCNRMSENWVQQVLTKMSSSNWKFLCTYEVDGEKVQIAAASESSLKSLNKTHSYEIVNQFSWRWLWLIVRCMLIYERKISVSCLTFLATIPHSHLHDHHLFAHLSVAWYFYGFVLDRMRRLQFVQCL